MTADGRGGARDDRILIRRPQRACPAAEARIVEDLSHEGLIGINAGTRRTGPCSPGLECDLAAEGLAEFALAQ
jgi:hypothetical protein